jgi:hypothetical protein
MVSLRKADMCPPLMPGSRGAISAGHHFLRAVLNHPGIPGGSIPWKRGWSYATRVVAWEAEHSALQRF